MIKINDDLVFNFMGIVMQVNDSIGIEAQSMSELFDKIKWCKK